MLIHVINGPNLNLLGQREPDIYGSETLVTIERQCQEIATQAGHEVTFRQSNHEGQIVDWVQESIGRVDAIVINAGAYTHTSVAIHDALRAYDGRIVELHISNPHARESFRHNSYVSSTAHAVVVGLGVSGYALVMAQLCSESAN
ncbi:MAG: type II 3-dehydroquinate dehydratase [Pseudomonadales bacterium]|nr:type II 3-dehydroquinate dehydratase [Pseudomonadales bacterium]